MMKFKVFEDNGGGLHMAALNQEDCVYFGSGYEYQRPGTLLADIKALRGGGNPTAWEGTANPQGRYNWAMTAVYCRNGGMRVIADNNGVYRALMGAAGAAEFTRSGVRAAYRRH